MISEAVNLSKPLFRIDIYYTYKNINYIIFQNNYASKIIIHVDRMWCSTSMNS